MGSGSIPVEACCHAAKSSSRCRSSHSNTNRRARSDISPLTLPSLISTLILSFWYLAWKCGGLWSRKRISMRIPKNSDIVGICLFLPISICKDTTIISIGEIYFPPPQKKALQNTVRRATRASTQYVFCLYCSFCLCHIFLFRFTLDMVVYCLLIQFSSRIPFMFLKSLVLSVTMVISKVTAVLPINRSKSSSSGVPCKRRRTFSSAATSITLVIGNMLTADKKHSSAVLRSMPSLCLDSSAPIFNSKAVISEI